MSIKQKPLTKKGMETRKKILETAEQTFGEKGYFETSVVDITQRAGVAQGTFYKYFPTKKDIYDELVFQMSKDLRSYIRENMDQSQDFETAQRQGYYAFFDWVKNHQNLYSVIQQAVLVDKDIYRWYYEKLSQGFINSLEEAMQKGECKDLNPETISLCLMGVGQFLGMRWILWEDEQVPDQVFEDAMEFAFRGLKN